MTSGEGFIKAAGGEEIPNAGAEPQRSRQRFPAASCPRPPRRRDAVVPPPLRPGPALHRPGPRHRLGRPLGPSAPAVPAEIPGCRRREAGESPPSTGRAPRWRPRQPHCAAPLLLLLPLPCSPPSPLADPLLSPLQTPLLPRCAPRYPHCVPSVPHQTSPMSLLQIPGRLLQPPVPRQTPGSLPEMGHGGWMAGSRMGRPPQPAQSVGDEEWPLPAQRAQPLEKLPEASPGCRTKAAASMQQEGVFCHARGQPGLGGRREKIPQ